MPPVEYLWIKVHNTLLTFGVFKGTSMCMPQNTIEGWEEDIFHV